VTGLFWCLLQGAALGTMVGQMTYGKRQFESLDGTVRQLLPIVHRAMNNLLPFVDADTAAFKQYMVAVRMRTRLGYHVTRGSEISVLWDETSCSLVERNRFLGTCFIHLQDCILIP
jgi:hypothetical protein